MPSPLARRVHRTIRSRSLWGDSDRVAVAVSGGADSVALLLVLAELAARARWQLAGMIHVNHGLRGAESDEDAAFCQRLAARLDLPIDVVSVDAAQARVRLRRSLEAAARVVRYEAFERAAGRLGATVVATAHTRDDQAETVLLRLLRGAAFRGVAAIRPRRGIYARPALDCRRAEMRRYLAACGQEHREDASNTDRSMARNRLRHDLMPVVEAGWPGGVAALARFADLASDDEQWLSTQAAAEGRDVVQFVAGGVELKKRELAVLPASLARRVIRDAIEAAGGVPAFREIEAVRRLARGPVRRGRLDLHGLVVEEAGEVVRIRGPVVASSPSAFEYRLDVPGEVRIAETGGTIRASFLQGSDRPAVGEGWDDMAALQASAVSLPLTVRSRRPGDRFTPLGAPGRRTLQDLLVDRKISRAMRSAVPVVVDANGRIVWVAGVAMAHDCRVQSPQSGMVILESKKGTL